MNTIKILPVRERVATELRRAIFAGQYKGGDELQQDNIAKTLGVSRMPVREAIQTLSAEGLVELIPNRGAFVKAIPDDFVSDYFFMRILLESAAAELACVHRTPEHIAAFNEFCTLEEQAILNHDEKCCEEQNEAIHRLIWSMAGNYKLETFLLQLWTGKPFSSSNPIEQAAISHMEHVQLLQDIESGNAALACEHMKKHIARSRDQSRSSRQS